ncbi:ABC transporter transmembrane domain-containing protein [Fodinicola feengrottensis]|uniref:ABC transporter transmembrane domain-containing protein n=1 Tax=Fodinicola feengrottensis TaxID=435914 RepID=UPI0024412033|nr:ABC transporter transmembrane domain-containing protein [Fodinicola feengrottensis]
MQILSATVVAVPITAVGAVILAIEADPVLALVLLTAVAGPGLVVLVALRKMAVPAGDMQYHLDHMNGVFREQAAGQQVIRAFGQEAAEHRRLSLVTENLARSALRMGRIYALTPSAIALALAVGSCAMIWVGAIRVDQGRLQVGEVSACLGYLTQVVSAIAVASYAAVAIPRARACAPTGCERSCWPPLR